MSRMRVVLPEPLRPQRMLSPGLNSNLRGFGQCFHLGQPLDRRLLRVLNVERVDHGSSCVSLSQPSLRVRQRRA